MTRPGLPLAGLELSVETGDGGAEHAVRLLRSLGAMAVRPEAVRGSDLLSAAGTSVTVESTAGPDADWAGSGAMWLTGTEQGPPLLPPGSGATAARGAMIAFELLSAIGGRRVSLPGHRLLGEHAAARGLRRLGPFSANGTTRIVRAANGCVALSLARPDDLHSTPALVEAVVTGDPWSAVAAWAAETEAAEAVARAQLVSIAAAVVPADARERFDVQAKHRGQVDGFEPFVVDGEVARPGRPAAMPRSFRPVPFAPLVVDLSSLWAGPLCAHLLGLAGARVVKVESTRRPDGARRGAAVLYDLLHGGHESVALDFADRADIGRLRRLIESADVVIEGSRPRALDQLGIDPADVVGKLPDTTWLSITAYGRTGPWANWVGFGDDTALAAGMAAVDPRGGTTVPCGDAIADPLTGVHAAVAVVASVLGGGSRVLDVALRDVVAATLPCLDRLPSRTAERRSDGWRLDTSSGSVSVEAPAIRAVAEPAPALGKHTDAVLAERGIA